MTKTMKVYTKITQKTAKDYADIETVSLCFDDRKRGRLKILCDSGVEAGIQIERGTVLRDGAVLEDADGYALQVLASQEKVSTAHIDDATLFARVSYHLGNRHVSLQIGEGFLRYQEDYVLDDMLHGLGVHVSHELAPFEPENGAYANGYGHSHGHSHEHSHDQTAHSHQHTHSHAHEH